MSFEPTFVRVFGKILVGPAGKYLIFFLSAVGK